MTGPFQVKTVTVLANFGEKVGGFLGVWSYRVMKVWWGEVEYGGHVRME